MYLVDVTGVRCMYPVDVIGMYPVDVIGVTCMYPAWTYIMTCMCMM